MKRRQTSDVNKPAHVRAINRLLAVCEMGMGEPDFAERQAFLTLAELLERTCKDWDKAGAAAVLSDKQEAALA